MRTRSSKQLESAIDDVLGRAQATPCFYKIKCIFTQADADWTYTPDRITGFNITQNFIGTYFDDVQIGFQAHPSDILDLLSKSKDLYCTVIATPHSWRTFLPYEEWQFVEKYRVYVENPGDMMKRYNLDKFKPVSDNDMIEPKHREAQLDITFQLISDFVYETRHRKITTLFGGDTTVEGAMQYVLNGFQIEKSEVTPCDNPMSFKNMEIPEGTPLGSVFPYLQQAHGVYKKGLCAYCLQDTMYIWPPFETCPDTKHTVHILLAPKDSYESHDCYHILTEEDDIKIVTISGAQTQNMMEQGSENTGTDIAVVNADKLIDHGGQMTSTGKYQIAKDRMSSAGLAADHIKVSDAQNVNSGGVTSNIYVAASKLASTNGVMFGCGWCTSTLEKFQPGQKVILHYDDEKGRYATQTGCLASISYSLTRSDIRAHAEHFWVFNSSISAFLEPEKKEEE